MRLYPSWWGFTRDQRLAAAVSATSAEPRTPEAVPSPADGRREASVSQPAVRPGSVGAAVSPTPSLPEFGAGGGPGAVSPTPEEAAATVRSVLERERRSVYSLTEKMSAETAAKYRGVVDAQVAALDSLVAALRDARRELDAMEWRRDWQYDKAVGWRNRAVEAERERDQTRDALAELRAELDSLRRRVWWVADVTLSHSERDVHAIRAQIELEKALGAIRIALGQGEFEAERTLRAALGGAAEDGA